MSSGASSKTGPMAATAVALPGLSRSPSGRSRNLQLRTALGESAFLPVAVAALLYLPGGHPLAPIPALGAALCFLLADRVGLGLKTGVVATYQPAVVLLMFTVPLNFIPALAVALKAASILLRGRGAAQLPFALGDSWYSVAPAAVLAFAAPGPARWSHAGVYAAAFAAGIVVDGAAGFARRALAGAEQLEWELVTPAAVDMLLTPVGLACAVSAVSAPGAAVVVLAGVQGLLLLLGHERARRFKEATRALHDPLTGVPNRALFHELLDAAARRCERTETRAALLLLDLDEFKLVNDTFGHQMGDEVLRAFAARARGCVRDADVLARVGGDEFAVLLCDPCEPEAAATVVAKLRDALSEPLELPGGARIRLRASCGTAFFGDGVTTQDAYARADAALYEDKLSRVLQINRSRC